MTYQIVFGLAVHPDAQHQNRHSSKKLSGKVLPIHFNNVFDMDLTDLDMSKEYLDFLRSNKQILALWVLEFVKDSDQYLFPHMGERDRSKKLP